jgi:hypothetical protein
MSDNLNKILKKICFFCEEKEIFEKYINCCEDCGKKASLNICPLCNIPYLTSRDYNNHIKHIDNIKSICRKYFKSLREIEKLKFKTVELQNNNEIQFENKAVEDNIQNEYHIYDILLNGKKNINETELDNIACFFKNTIEDYKLTHVQNIIKNNGKILPAIKTYIINGSKKILRDVESKNYDKENIKNKIIGISKLKYYVCSFYNSKIIKDLDMSIEELNNIKDL